VPRLAGTIGPDSDDGGSSFVQFILEVTQAPIVKRPGALVAEVLGGEGQLLHPCAEVIHHVLRLQVLEDGV
jgi:hypothetical protein